MNTLFIIWILLGFIPGMIFLLVSFFKYQVPLELGDTSFLLCCTIAGPVFLVYYTAYIIRVKKDLTKTKI